MTEKGITNILVKQLEDVPITERPIHCADVKRKKFYVKDDDEWKKTQPSTEMNGISDGKSDREMYKKFEIKTTFGYGNRMEEQNPDHLPIQKRKMNIWI